MLSQIAIASRKKRNWSKPPTAFTEHGAVMAANVLKSKRAVAMSVEVIRAFIRLRRSLASHGVLSKKFTELESAVRRKLNDHDVEIDRLFQTVEFLLDKAG